MELKGSARQLCGVGPKKLSALKKLKIETIEDLLTFYPREYEDRRNEKPIKDLELGEMALIKGTISLMVKGGYAQGKKRTLRLLVEDETGAVEVIFFNGAYLEKTLKRDVLYSFFGKVSGSRAKLYLSHPDFEVYTYGTGREILPVYPLTAGLSQKNLRKWESEALQLMDEAAEPLPAETLVRNRLCSMGYALFNIHFPKDMQKNKEAKFRLIFEELLLLQTGLLLIRNRLSKLDQGICFSEKASMHEFTDTLPYALTGAQERVLSEINADMESPKVMNRLIQGDVGSGKTVIAAAAVFKAIKSGYQAVMMAPTELLAKQHYESLKSVFESFGFEVGFLSGAVGAKEKKKLLKALSLGEISFLIGTHALIRENVIFSKLGLAITDEQHRFGVYQRGLLAEKGSNPDTLVMTATPIPRTLAVILYGDLDSSILDELPVGRKPIKTSVIHEAGREAAYSFLKKELETGRQGYVVAPLISESESLELRSAETLFMELSERFQEFSVALLHGAMNSAEKDRVMREFYGHRIDLLVSTVVIEVGINVPNATVMLIENAERFGLAQLHQLRGRVGRGGDQAYCILITEAKTKMAADRMAVMEKTGDGFVIAEKDLQLRGPGEFFGMRQHGVPELKIADLVKHLKLLKPVRTEAELLLQADVDLSQKEHKAFLDKIKKTFENVENIRI